MSAGVRSMRHAFTFVSLGALVALAISTGLGQHAADAALQKVAGVPLAVKTAKGFPGIGANGYIPPDPNIAVGLSYIVQVVNSQIAVYDKSGALLSGPKSLSSIWSNL